MGRSGQKRVKTQSIAVAAGILVALGIGRHAAAQTGVPAPKVARLKLPNGLTVLALENHSVPSVAYYTVFKVGSRNERPGITGISHLFEHMMFNGSAKYPPKRFDQLVEAGGGSSDAFTNYDTTEYFEEVSSPTLDTVLLLEADRMRALKLDRANIEQERGIVKEERRVNTDNRPQGAMGEQLENTVFIAHPYHWDVIGFMRDIDAIRLADAKEYFRIHYAPNNAVVAVVGDLDTSALFKQIRADFGDIPAHAGARSVVRDEPAQKGERRVSFHHAAEVPAVDIGYHVGTYRDADDPALDVLSTILSHGESSRLYRSLVRDKQIAASVNTSDDSRADPGMFTIYAQAQPGHNAQECEQAIYAVLDDIGRTGVTARELQKAKNVLRAGYVESMETNLGIAGQLAEYEANWGDWHRMLDFVRRHDAVTVDDVKRVANRYFAAENRSVVTLVPEK